jgi:hypothetical protein
MSKNKDLLNSFLEQEELKAPISRAIDTLDQTRVFELLRAIARVPLYPSADSASFLAVQAHNAAYVQGYNSCIDDLENFMEKFCEKRKETQQIAPSFLAPFLKSVIDDEKLN